MQKWIRKAAHSLAAAQGADQSREDVIAYGLTALCQMGAILLGALVIGLAAGMVWECLLIYLVVGTFRKCTGGAHAPSLLGCILTSLRTIGAMAGAGGFPQQAHPPAGKDPAAAPSELRLRGGVHPGLCRNGGSILAAAPADDGAERICFADSRPLLAVVYPYGSCRIAVVPPWG